MTKMINNLKLFRKKNKYTQAELAYICGVSRNTISSLERGEYLPGVVLYMKLRYVLGNFYGSPYGLSDEDTSELRQRMEDIYTKHHPDECT